MHEEATRNDLLVSYAWGRYGRAKSEILRILKALGDPAPRVDQSAEWGIAIGTTRLDNRDRIRRCHALWERRPREPST